MYTKYKVISLVPAVAFIAWFAAELIMFDFDPSLCLAECEKYERIIP